MTFSSALAIALATALPVSPDLCAGFENRIEPDMRILASDLTRDAAIAAAEELRAAIERGDAGYEAQVNALQQAKAIHGYLLLRQVHADRRDPGADSTAFQDSVAAFCTWLGTDGFWYD